MLYNSPTVKDINPINDAETNISLIIYLDFIFLFLYTINNIRIKMTHNEHQNALEATHHMSGAEPRARWDGTHRSHPHSCV